MSPELQKKLFENHSRIFKQRHLSIRESCMAWGIDTNDGWYNIIDQLCSIIQRYIDNERKQRARDLLRNRAIKRAINGDKSSLINYHSLYKNEVTQWTLDQVERDIQGAMVGKINPITAVFPKVQATQVKEKYGTLRFYTNWSNDYIDGLISMATGMSSVTCETCGKIGKLRGLGWFYTSCDEHSQISDLHEE